MVTEDPGYLISFRGFLFLLDVSSFGLQASWAFFFFRGPLALASLDLACFFFFWAWLTLLGFSHCDSFRPQQQVSSKILSSIDLCIYGGNNFLVTLLESVWLEE